MTVVLCPLHSSLLSRTRRVRRGLLDGPVSALKAFLRTRGPPHPVLPSHLVARDSGAPDGAGVSTETSKALS
jgi:hypothetical protein